MQENVRAVSTLVKSNGGYGVDILRIGVEIGIEQGFVNTMRSE